MCRLFFLSLSVFWLCQPYLVSGDSRSQFKSWYAEFRPQFETILHSNCSSEYETYLTAPKRDAPVDWLSGGGNTNRLAQPVTNCILENTSEYIKSNMAAAAVVLGLMPTILATVGNSVEETSTLCVIAQRPLLAFLLATASPAISPTRPFEPSEPRKLVDIRPHTIRPKEPSSLAGITIMVVEYLTTAVVIANTMTLCQQLGIQVVSTIAPHLTYLQVLWSIIGITIHVSGALSLWCRTQFKSESLTRKSYVIQILRQQFRPIDKTAWIKAEPGDETYPSMMFSYFTSLLGTCHVIYGTVLFSSLIFISVRDSLTVLSRYMASAMVSRTILMYELHKMRGIINKRNEDIGAGLELTARSGTMENHQ
jgi:hypothetical protein